MKKIFLIPDTNVLLHNKNFIKKFKQIFNIVILEPVIYELDNIKDNKQQQYAVNIQKDAGYVINHIAEYKLYIHKININKLTNSNDEKIYLYAEDFAADKQEVYLYSSDKIYKTFKSKQMKIIDEDEFLQLLKQYQNDEYSNIGQQYYKAVENSDLNSLKQIGHFKDINYISPFTDYSPFYLAVKKRKLDIIKYILSNPYLDINQVCDKHSIPPLSCAVQQHEIKIVEMLINAGADVNRGSEGRNYNNTALMIASWHGFDDIVDILLRNLVCCNQQDSNGFTALIKACIKGHEKIIKKLINKTDIDIKSKDQYTALDYLSKEHNDLYKKLKNKGVI